ncbi:MAG: hypothetical protein ABI882_00325 [Acidobacteriota bacterium]
MKRKLTIFSLTMILALAPASALVPAATVGPQRERRPPRDLGASAQVATDDFSLPAGTVLVLKMETRLDSGRSRTSDRFVAKLVEAVISTSGKELIPAGAAVEGFVEDVNPAQMRRRSGIIAVRFDLLRMPDGRGIPVDGILTEADSGSRKPKIDDENNVVGGSTAKQSIVFIGGAVGAGAAIGAIAGGALLGVGVGAAAGAAAAWLGKGKEAVVEKGTRIGLQLSKPLDLGLGASGIARVDPKPTKRDGVRREEFVRRTTDPEPETVEDPANARPQTQAAPTPATVVTGSAAELAARIADKIEVLLTDYADSIGAKRSPQGGYEFDKQRQPSGDSMELLFVLSNLLDSAQVLKSVPAGDSGTESRRRGADRLSTHAQEVDRRWSGANPGTELDRKWRALEAEIRQLVQTSRS